MYVLRCCCLLLLLIIAGTTTQAQQKKPNPPKKEFEEVFIPLPNNAEPIGRGWDSCLRQAATLPDSIQRTIPPGTYKVSFGFIVTRQGGTKDFTIKQDPGYGLSERVVEIMSGCTGRWNPLKQGGFTVNMYRKDSVLIVVGNKAGQPALAKDTATFPRNF